MNKWLRNILEIILIFLILIASSFIWLLAFVGSNDYSIDQIIVLILGFFILFLSFVGKKILNRHFMIIIYVLISYPFIYSLVSR